MPKVGIGKVGGTHEECLQTLFGTRNHGGVIAEKQTAEYGDHHNSDKIGFRARLILLHNYIGFKFMF